MDRLQWMKRSKGRPTGDSAYSRDVLDIADRLKIAQQGVHLELTILSDEHSETFSYDYKP